MYINNRHSHKYFYKCVHMCVYTYTKQCQCVCACVCVSLCWYTYLRGFPIIIKPEAKVCLC